MSDLSLVLCSFSWFLEATPPIRNSRLFHRFCIFDAKVRHFSELCKFLANFFSKKRKKCFRAASPILTGREPQHLSILSVSRLLLRSSFFLCNFRYTFMVRYPPFCTTTIQVLTSSIFSAFGIVQVNLALCSHLFKYSSIQL